MYSVTHSCIIIVYTQFSPIFTINNFFPNVNSMLEQKKHVVGGDEAILICDYNFKMSCAEFYNCIKECKQ